MIFGISNDSNVDYISQLFVWFIFCRLLHFFANIPEFVKSAQDLASLDFKAANLIIALTGLPILLTNVVLHSVSDHKRGQDSLEATESTSSHFSYLFFSWMDNLIWKGWVEVRFWSILPIFSYICRDAVGRHDPSK